MYRAQALPARTLQLSVTTPKTNCFRSQHESSLFKGVRQVQILYGTGILYILSFLTKRLLRPYSD